jgi:hypothetical protein
VILREKKIQQTSLCHIYAAARDSAQITFLGLLLCKRNATMSNTTKKSARNLQSSFIYSLSLQDPSLPKPLKSSICTEKKIQHRHFQLLPVHLLNVFIPKFHTTGEFYRFCARKRRNLFIRCRGSSAPAPLRSKTTVTKKYYLPFYI